LIRELKQHDDNAEDTTTGKKTEFIFHKRNSRLSNVFGTRMALKRAEAKYATTAFNSKWNYLKFAFVDVVVSRSCFAEDGKEMYKDI